MIVSTHIHQVKHWDYEVELVENPNEVYTRVGIRVVDTDGRIHYITLYMENE